MPRLLLSCLLLLMPALATAASVNGVRLWAGPDTTRVVFDLSGPVEHNLFTLGNPARVVIDIENARLTAGGMPGGDGVVRRIRHAPRNGDDLRVVFDLSAEAQAKSFVLPPHEQYGYRLVVDLENPGAGEPRVIRQAPAGEKRDLIIAIDAGHGGEDPGAIGSRGTREKDVVLQVARRLAALVEKERGMTPVLVRTGDYYISLRERMDIARRNRADLFISIHADAFRDRRASGSSVYILSERGASSEAARWLAEQENAADLVGGVKLDDKDDMLKSVLLDLSQTATISASMRAASTVLGEIDKIAKLHKSDVQQAAFVVLKSPDIPSMLVETAFISNPDEERKLRDAAYQERLARAMLAGVREYFYANPVPGTLIAERVRKGGIEYVINRGDTLSAIARRYQVSVDALRSFNNLDGDILQVGQVLRIPAPGNYET